MSLIALLVACDSEPVKPDPQPDAPPDSGATTPSTSLPPHEVVLEVTGEAPVVRLRALGDTDGDGADEVLAVTSDDVALVIGVGGTLARFTGLLHAAPGGDADADGFADLAFISDTSQMGFVRGPVGGEQTVDAALVAPIAPPVGYAVRTGSDVMRDRNGDGRSDFIAMVVDLESGDPSLWDGATLIPLTSLASSSGGLALLDGDRVAFHTSSGSVEVLETDTQLSASLFGMPRSTRYAELGLRGLGDLDGDGSPDVAATASQGRASGMGVLSTSGAAAVLPGAASLASDVAGEFDLDGDGQVDVALTWWDGVGRHVAVGFGPWTALADNDLEVRIEGPEALTGPVAAADVDGDGVPDLAVGRSDGILVVSGASVLTAPSDAVAPPPHLPLDGCAGAPAELRVLASAGTPPMGGTMSVADAPVTLVNDDFAVIESDFSALAVGDVDGDGAVDLLVGADKWLGFDNETSGVVNAVRAPTLGTQSLATSQQVPGLGSLSYFGVHVVAGDVDGDGIDDVFTGDWLLRSSPDGMACPAEGEPFDSGYGSRGAFLADVSGDGLPELAISHDVDPYDRIRRKVEIRPSPDPLGAAPRLVLTETGNNFTQSALIAAVADWDGDGRTDLAVQADHDWLSDAWVSVVDAGGTGTVAVADAAHATFELDGDVNAMASGDVDGDGYSDLMVGVVEPLSGRNEGAIYILRGGTSGTTPMSQAAAGEILGTEAFQELGMNLALGDTSGEGELDLLANQDDGQAWLFHDLGPGSRDTAAAGARFVPGDGFLTIPLALADLDGDGAEDVVLTGKNLGIGEVYVFFGGER